jgi:hypothetical protein
MIIDDLNIQGICAVPSETDAILVVDSNAALVLAIAFEFLQMQAFPIGQISKRLGVVEQHHFSVSRFMQRRRKCSPGKLGRDLRCDVSGASILEAPDRYLYHYTVQ